MSNFGEAQQVDQLTIEERAVKILELAPSTVVALCGDVGLALDFVESVGMRLRHSDQALRAVIATVAASADLSSSFQLLFGHRINDVAELTAFTSSDRRVEGVGLERFATFGSMPPDKKALAARLVTAVRQHKLPPHARLAASLVALQAIGITEYLPQYGVGGAYFGVHVSRGSVLWQPDLCYLTYPPGLFADSPILQPDEAKAAVPSTNDLEMVRVLARDGAGILLSSMGSPRGRLLIPPNHARSSAEWQRIVLDAVPPPFPLVVPCCHFGLLSRRYPKAAYIYNPDLRDGAFAITKGNGTTYVEAAPRLVETLELATPHGSFDLSIVTEDSEGTDTKTYRVKMPS